MLKELLGIEQGILADLHTDHEKVSGLSELQKLGEQFRRQKEKLLAAA